VSSTKSNKSSGSFVEDYYMAKATGDEDLLEHALKYNDVPDEEERELPADEEMEKVFDRSNDERAEYKIEIRFGSQRTRSLMNAQIHFWLSGRMLAGGGDDLMFLCGYDDCQSPIPSDNVGQSISHEALGKLKGKYMMQGLEGHWSICPTCMKEGRNNNGKQATSIESMGYHLDRDANKVRLKTRHTVIVDPLTNARYPCIRDSILISATPQVIAEMLATYWYKLAGDADIYMKYHPMNIKAQYSIGVFNTGRPTWDAADELAIYPVSNIIKDTSAGASLVGRFKAFILS